MNRSLLTIIVCLQGCITAPDVVLVDHLSVLEKQAAGPYPEREDQRNRHALQPTVVPYTTAQLADASWRVGQTPTQNLVDLYGGISDETEEVHQLLLVGCLGEGADGLLVGTPQRCATDQERLLAQKLEEEVNRQRRQLFAWLQRQGGEEAFASWRRHHHQGLPCGAYIEGGNGSWSEKAC